MLRLRLSAYFAAVGAGALLAGGVAGGAWAQTVSPRGELRASIDDNLDFAPSRRSAGSRAGTSRAGARDRAPQFGNPPGWGAGEAGYVSTNLPRPRSRKLPPGQGNLGSGTGAVSGETRPARPGSVNTGPSRPGAAIDVPAGAATPPIRRNRTLEEDPFEPLGIRAGGFVLRPAIETTAGYDSNPGRTRNGRGSSFYAVTPELLVRSNWSRHALNADIRGTYTAYGQLPSLDQPMLDARANGRIDITRQTRADFEARTILSTTSPGSPDLPAATKGLPAYLTVGGSAGIAQQFNRFDVALKGAIDRVTYDDAELTNGAVLSQQDRNYNQYAALLRAAYELTPGVKPFAEIGYDTRVRDIPVDSFGVHRDSQGATGRLGTTFEISSKLTGEFSVGYLVRTYKDPTLPDLRGLIADASVVYAATALTTAKFTAKSNADESTLPGVAGVLRRDFGAQVDHAFRRWLIGTARIGYGLDNYEGSDRKDERYVAAVAMTYKATRSVQVKGELRQEWLRSSVPGPDYTATVVLAGLRLQR